MSTSRTPPELFARPCDEHDPGCTGVRWLVHQPIITGSRLVQLCAGCTATRIITAAEDGTRHRRRVRRNRRAA